MATYTSNYGWTKPSGSDNVDISVLNNNLDDQDSTIHDAFLNMAPPFSESSTYAVDDIVLYTTGLYKCHTAVVTPGSWTGSTNWQVYKLSEGGGGGLTLGETSSTAYRGDRGKVAYDHSQTTGNPHGTTASDVGLGNVPNVSTNDQTPTFTEASTRNNIASGEKLSVIFGKIQKFFNDLKTVAFSGSYTDLSNKPSIPTKTSDITNDSNFVSDANYVHTDNNFTTSEKTKLAGIASGAEANVQANWSQTNTSADDFIKNKPNLATVATSGSYADLSNKPTIPTSAGGISYDNTGSGLTATDVQGAVDEVNSDLTKMLTRGRFVVACTAGQNKITSSTPLLSGVFPSHPKECLYSIVNHGTTANSPNTVEADGFDIIINSKTSQNITVVWLDIINVVSAT